jgi:hypothetical protein
MVVAVAAQRACAPAAKRHLSAFLAACVPRVSCLPAAAFTGQTFHRLAAQITDAQLEQAQIAIAEAAVERFGLAADVLAFDTTNFDTHIATTTPGELAQRGHAKSKRGDLRVVGLAVLASETGHVRSGTCTRRWTKPRGAPTRPRARWCGMGGRGARNWNWISTWPGTTPSSLCR